MEGMFKITKVLSSLTMEAERCRTLAARYDQQSSGRKEAVG